MTTVNGYLFGTGTIEFPRFISAIFFDVLNNKLSISKSSERNLLIFSICSYLF